MDLTASNFGSLFDRKEKLSLGAVVLLAVYPMLAFMGQFPIEGAGFPLSLEHVIIAICGVLILFECAFGSLTLRCANGPFLAGLAVWFGGNALSLLFYPNKDGNIVVLGYFQKCLFCYLAFLVLAENHCLLKVMKCYLVGCLIAGLFTLYYFLYHGASLQDIRVSAYGWVDDVGQLQVDLMHGLARNGAGNVLPLWFSLIFLMLYPDKGRKRLYLGLAAIFLILSLMALRRETLVHLLIGFIVLLAWAPRGCRWPAVSIMALFLCGAGYLILGNEDWRHRLFEETVDSFNESQDPRTAMLKATPAALLDKPLLGHGPGNYRTAILNYIDIRGVVQETGLAAHNSFSAAALEAGSVGLVGAVIMTGALFIQLIRRRQYPTSDRHLVWLTSVFIFLEVLDRQSFGDGLYAPQTWFWFGILLAQSKIMEEHASAQEADATQGITRGLVLAGTLNRCPVTAIPSAVLTQAVDSGIAPPGTLLTPAKGDRGRRRNRSGASFGCRADLRP